MALCTQPIWSTCLLRLKYFDTAAVVPIGCKTAWHSWGVWIYIIPWICYEIKFQWIISPYMKPISFQSKASVVCSVTEGILIDFCLKKLNVFSQHIGKKYKWISELRITNPQELKCWSTLCVYYFLRYYLMIEHQPIVKRGNGTHEWAHRPDQLLSTPYHCCLYKPRRQDERQPSQSSWPVPICT